MSEANGNGHAQMNGDVYPRIGKLETGMARLESNVQVLHDQLSVIGKNIEKFGDALGKSKEANYPFMWQLLIGSVAITATLGGIFIAPLRAADSYHEEQMREMRAQLRQDHDTLIRIQERELIRREMGK